MRREREPSQGCCHTAWLGSPWWKVVATSVATRKGNCAAVPGHRKNPTAVAGNTADKGFGFGFHSFKILEALSSLYVGSRHHCRSPVAAAAWGGCRATAEPVRRPPLFQFSRSSFGSSC
nr:uncharacterized protein LOC112801161 isoform X2 [Arachis hypogaea]